MNSNNSCCESQVQPKRCGCGCGNGFVIIIVLYILLAIILGSCLY